eukprot:TRINITY_DN2228_c2_g1_i2.p1 TRINITY_DN2228_c2_g1~~TRINITY_DN2228_c2_g1_i2.p1  ORF type:complete len:1350 (+),score=403.07 TRINITY_DN2228_c2_g1_i2:35-4084(+)
MPSKVVNLTIDSDKNWLAASDGDKIYKYRTEYALSGRARCKRCGELVKQGDVRIGIPVKWKYWINSWAHPQCVRTQEQGKELEKVIYGFKDLKGKDKKVLIETLNGDPLKNNDLAEEDDWLPSCSAADIKPLNIPSLPLLPHQKIGTAWMVNQEKTSVKGGILADEMGMGKTLQTIGLLFHTKTPMTPTLVITPASAMGQWEEEIKRFAPSLKVLIFHGMTKKLKVSDLKKHHVVLTTFSKLEAEYRKILNEAKVSCKYCQRKLLPASLKLHLKYFCGPKATRTKKQQLREKKGHVAAEKAKATLGIGESVPSMTNIYKEIMNESGRAPIGRYDKGSRALQRDAEKATNNITVQPIGMKPFYIDPKENPTLAKVQETIHNKYGVTPADQTLIHQKASLAGAKKKLSAFGIQQGDIIHVSFTLSESDSDSDSDSDVPKAKRTKKTKPSAKKSKPAVDASSSDEESESDFPKTQVKKKAATKPPTKQSKKGANSKKQVTESESSSESEAAPQLKGKPAAKQSKKNAKPSGKKSKRQVSESDSSDSDSESSEASEQPVKKAGAKKPATKQSKKRAAMQESSEDSDSSESEASVQAKKKVAKKPATKQSKKSTKPLGKKSKGRGDSHSSGSSSSDSESVAKEQSKKLQKPAGKKGKAASSSEDSDSSESSEDSLQKKALKKSTTKRGVKPTGKKAVKGTDSDTGSSDSGSVAKKKPAGKANKRGKPAAKRGKKRAISSDSDSESTESSSESVKKGKGKKLVKKENKKRRKDDTSSEESSSDSESTESSSESVKKGKGKKLVKKVNKKRRKDDTSSEESSSDDSSSDSSDSSDSDKVGKKRKRGKKEKKDTDDKDDINNLDFEQSLMYKLTWHRLVIDEAHRIKSRTTNTAKAVYAVKAENKWGLTGTPLQNRVGDLFSLIRYLRFSPYAYYLCSGKDCDCKSLEWKFGKECSCGHSMMRHYSSFKKQILNPISRYGYIGEGNRAFEMLKSDVLSKIQLRRTKLEVAKDIKLPELKVIIHKGELDEREMDFYEALYKRSTAKFDGYVSKGTLMHNYAHIFELLARLRQAVDHPYIVTKNKINTADVKKVTRVLCSICGEEITDNSTAVKVPCRHVFHSACCELYLEMSVGEEVACPGFCCDKKFKKSSIAGADEEKEPKGKKKAKENNEKESMMEKVDEAEFTSSTKLEDLVKYMKAVPKDDKCIIFSQYNGMLDLVKWRLQREGIVTAQLTGSMAAEKRSVLLKEFRENSKVRALLLSLRAGGEGLNLQIANHVFTLDPWWNPAVELQAIQRAHRIGQTKPVTAVRFVTQNTIEEKMYQLQEKKQLVFDGTIDGSNAALSRLSGEDINFLFNH